VKLTRIKGLRISQIFGSESNGTGGVRFMYSIDGCKWKIFGARPKLPQVAISNATIETSIKAEPRKVGVTIPFTTVFQSDDQISV
jgi:hypothetical protein